MDAVTSRQIFTRPTVVPHRDHIIHICAPDADATQAIRNPGANLTYCNTTHAHHPRPPSYAVCPTCGHSIPNNSNAPHPTCPTCGQTVFQYASHTAQHYAAAAPDPRDTLLYGRRPDDYLPAPPRFFRDDAGIRWIPTLPDGAANFNFRGHDGGGGMKWRSGGGAVGTGGERRVFHP
ncbi:Uu.00g137990.m01.CDS01 [Anthostomella pinea]|uniref:Uu.00g137990.m01.CDS01 n=1 Tax=Anthostomella pinea TaxID=933095 RepID=A0AAI8VQJ4_9PEZI|nr:Uu.00g137990.m01.CDS01 [Anthostomella pinea]